jgi:carbon-monoxide dehydrogenase small subunit
MTVEGLGAGGLSPLQESFLTSGAVQCGFCIPGMVMAATALLEHVPHPTEIEIREALSGNLCRCGGYTRISAAVLAVSTAGAADV